MRLIDADALIDRIKNPYEQAQVARWVNEQPTIEPEKRTETHACDLIDREAAVDAIYHHLPSVSRTRARTMLHALPSAQPELYKDEVSRQAVEHLDLFTKAYCRDKSVTNDLAFRCEQCDFEMPDGKCLIKTMARKLCPDYKNFGCMGDL